MTVAQETWFMTLRHMRALIRQPWWIAFSLLQPLIYMLLFGQLFKRIVELPGFASDSYIEFLTPGIVIVSALFGAGWSGMGTITDLDRGVLDRFLVTPTSRTSLIAGRLLLQSVITVVQALIIIGVGIAMGARFDGGVIGIAVLILCAVLLAAPVGALSNAMALVARKEETVIGAANFILLPLSYLSAVFIDLNLTPVWIQTIARFNPLNWAVRAGREVLGSEIDWTFVLMQMGYLIVLTIASAWLATRAFRSYQRAI